MIHKALTISGIRWCAIAAMVFLPWDRLAGEKLEENEELWLMTEKNEVIQAARSYSRTEGIAVIVRPGRDLAAHGLSGEKIGSFLVESLIKEEPRTKPKAFIYNEIEADNSWVIFLVHGHHPRSYDEDVFPQLYSPSQTPAAVPEIAALFMRHVDLQEEYRTERRSSTVQEGSKSGCDNGD